MQRRIFIGFLLMFLWNSSNLFSISIREISPKNPGPVLRLNNKDIKGVITKEDFKGIDVSNVRLLDLYGNKIEGFGPGALDRFTNLQVLLIGDNQIEAKKINKAAFKGLNKLWFIAISKNASPRRTLKQTIQKQLPKTYIFSGVITRRFFKWLVTTAIGAGIVIGITAAYLSSEMNALRGVRSRSEKPITTKEEAAEEAVRQAKVVINDAVNAAQIFEWEPTPGNLAKLIRARIEMSRAESRALKLVQYRGERPIATEWEPTPLYNAIKPKNEVRQEVLREFPNASQEFRKGEVERRMNEQLQDLKELASRQVEQIKRKKEAFDETISKILPAFLDKARKERKAAALRAVEEELLKETVAHPETELTEEQEEFLRRRAGTPLVTRVGEEIEVD